MCRFLKICLHSSLVGPVIPVETHVTMWLLYGLRRPAQWNAISQELGSRSRGVGFVRYARVPVAAVDVRHWFAFLASGCGAASPFRSRLASHAGMDGRSTTRAAPWRLVVALLVVAVCTGGGLWYRVANSPTCPNYSTLRSSGTTYLRWTRTRMKPAWPFVVPGSKWIE